MMKALACPLFVFLIALSGCATAYNPATGQREFIFITTPAEVSLGKMLDSKIVKEFKISKDAGKINRLAEIGKKIAEVSDRKDLTYHFNVIEDESLNAFTSPGGYIYVNSGILDKANDDELACVIGHEAGHIAARHIAKKLQSQIGYDILMNIAARKSGLSELRQAASVSYNLIMLGYSREDEMLGDRLGAKYAYRAGYDPYAMISFLKKIQEADGKELGFVFLRSHPYASQRIKMLEAQIPSIKEKELKKGGTAGPGSIAKAVSNTGKARPLKVMCPKCKRIFSGKANYCPYDGTRLE